MNVVAKERSDCFNGNTFPNIEHASCFIFNSNISITEHETHMKVLDRAMIVYQNNEFDIVDLFAVVSKKVYDIGSGADEIRNCECCPFLPVALATPAAAATTTPAALAAATMAAATVATVAKSNRTFTPHG